MTDRELVEFDLKDLEVGHSTNWEEYQNFESKLSNQLESFTTTRNRLIQIARTENKAARRKEELLSGQLNQTRNELKLMVVQLSALEKEVASELEKTADRLSKRAAPQKEILEKLKAAADKIGSRLGREELTETRNSLQRKIRTLTPMVEDLEKNLKANAQLIIKWEAEVADKVQDTQKLLGEKGRELLGIEPEEFEAPTPPTPPPPEVVTEPPRPMNKLEAKLKVAQDRPMPAPPTAVPAAAHQEQPAPAPGPDAPVDIHVSLDEVVSDLDISSMISEAVTSLFDESRVSSQDRAADPAPPAAETVPATVTGMSTLLLGDANHAYDLMSQFVEGGDRLLVISPRRPSRISTRFAVPVESVLWVGTDDSLYADLDGLGAAISEFCAGGTGVVFLDGLEFAVTAHGLERTFRWMQHVVRTSTESGQLFFSLLSPQALAGALGCFEPMFRYSQNVGTAMV